MSYNSFGLDERTRMLVAREHAAELRESWRAANSPRRVREDELQQPCSERRRDQSLALVLARLFSGLRRRTRIDVADPCS